MAILYYQIKGINPLEELYKEVMNFNVKTTQKITSMPSTALMYYYNPEKLLEKNIEVLFKNGYITLNYLSNVLDIMEKQCLTNFDNIKGVWNNMADISRAYNEVYSKMLYSHP
ncbi:hypothetical protein OQJ13_16140 [Legionella sp. PATHC035]|uniref:hypothetical protein n=1 Tax=Legionella sp. PATHC035 TaxID=2992040 RepID=UPI002244A625|nr:hypothetical protein [Legionella sp. PATHC035]MCW8410511.1 hypothetical protein [Legionella sp. PATHC035]